MRHPLLRAIRVAVDQVGSIGELHAARAQRVVGGADVLDPQVKNRFGRRLFLRVQVEPRTTAVEERECAESVEVRQPERLAVLGFRLLDVAHGARDLGERTERNGSH